MPYGTIYSDTVQSSTANTPAAFYDGNSREIGRLCRGFLNFNGGSPPTVVASLNISSLTYTGAGLYTANFSFAYQDAGYAIGSITSTPGGATTGMNISSQSTSSVGLKLGYWYSSSWYTFDGAANSLTISR